MHFLTPPSPTPQKPNSLVALGIPHTHTHTHCYEENEFSRFGGFGALSLTIYIPSQGVGRWSEWAMIVRRHPPTDSSSFPFHGISLLLTLIPSSANEANCPPNPARDLLPPRSVQGIAQPSQFQEMTSLGISVVIA